jgi:hypothetical protein
MEEVVNEMEVNALNAYTHKEERLNLGILKSFILRCTGMVKIGKRSYAGWTGSAEFYVSLCEEHNKYFIDYPHSFNYEFRCPYAN